MFQQSRSAEPQMIFLCVKYHQLWVWQKYKQIISEQCFSSYNTRVQIRTREMRCVLPITNFKNFFFFVPYTRGQEFCPNSVFNNKASLQFLPAINY